MLGIRSSSWSQPGTRSGGTPSWSAWAPEGWARSGRRWTPSDGAGNPLGARALYLFQNKQDTLYRIHGACEPKYLGQAVSSGCIRLLDQDVIDLHDRVQDGAKLIVLASTRYGEFEALY